MHFVRAKKMLLSITICFSRPNIKIFLLVIDFLSPSLSRRDYDAFICMTWVCDVGRICLCSEQQNKTCVFFSRVFCLVLIFERHRGRLDLRYYMKMWVNLYFNVCSREQKVAYLSTVLLVSLLSLISTFKSRSAQNIVMRYLQGRV